MQYSSFSIKSLIIKKTFVYNLAQHPGEENCAEEQGFETTNMIKSNDKFYSYHGNLFLKNWTNWEDAFSICQSKNLTLPNIQSAADYLILKDIAGIQKWGMYVRYEV